MVKTNRTSRSGDLILDRYMSDSSEVEREEARENLRAYAKVVLRIATRLATEEYEQAIRANESRMVDSENGPPPSL
jgi:hypothetical protein